MDMTRYPLELLDFCIAWQFYVTFPCIYSYYHRPEHRSIITQKSCIHRDILWQL